MLLKAFHIHSCKYILKDTGEFTAYSDWELLVISLYSSFVEEQF